MSSEKKFNVKDKVFAKRRGYPAWPAIISNVTVDASSQIFYDVHFYGLGDNVLCTADKLFSYEENKSKLSNPKGTLNKLMYFSEALVLIENDTNTSNSSKNNSQFFVTPNNKEKESSYIKSESLDEVGCINKLNSKNISRKKNLKIQVDCPNADEKNILENRSEDQMLVENDLEESVLSKDHTQLPLTPSITEQESHSNKNENNNKINKFNSESKEKLLLNDSGLLKKKKSRVSKKKLLCWTTSKKKKRSHFIISKKALKIPLKTIDLDCLPTPIVLLESLDDSQIAMAINKQQNSKSDENTDVSQHIFETSESHNTTESTFESNDVLPDSNKTSKIETSSTKNIKVSRFSRKIKLKDYHSPKEKMHSKLRQKAKTAMAKTTNNNNTRSSHKSNYSSEQNCISKGISLNSETNDTLSTTPETSILTNSSSSIDINLFQLKIHDEDMPRDTLNDLMTESLSDMKLNCMNMNEYKMSQINLLQTEVDLLDYVHDLRVALQINHVDYEKALEVLEKTNKLKINGLMLLKHPCVISTFIKVMNYIGNETQWNLSKYEALMHVNNVKLIQSKARQIFEKCSLLFIIPDGQTFQEVFERKLNDFVEITKNLSCDQIYSLTANFR